MWTPRAPRGGVAGPWGRLQESLTCTENNWAAPALMTDGNEQSYCRTGSTSSSYFTACQRLRRPEEMCPASPLDGSPASPLDGTTIISQIRRAKRVGGETRGKEGGRTSAER